MLLTLIAVLAFGGARAVAQTIPSLNLSPERSDRAVASYFTQDSVGDVQLGRLGELRARNAAVRDLAHAMVRDHTRTAHMGLETANAVGADVEFKAGSDNEIELAHLAQYYGAEFDREYVKALIKAHKTDIGVANDALGFVRNPQLRNYLEETLTIDRRHLEMAEAARY